jgi:hypothetical protein
LGLGNQWGSEEWSGSFNLDQARLQAYPVLWYKNLMVMWFEEAMLYSIFYTEQHNAVMEGTWTMRRQATLSYREVRH